MYTWRGICTTLDCNSKQGLLSFNLKSFFLCELAHRNVSIGSFCQNEKERVLKEWKFRVLNEYWELLSIKAALNSHQISIMRILTNSITCHLWHVNVAIFYFNGIILSDLYKSETCKPIRSGLENCWDISCVWH